MRSLWSGSLSFGLINIPVRIYGVSEERELKFHLLDKHGHCPISYLKVCRGTKKEVRYGDIVAGYEYQKGDYVILTDEDFERAAPYKAKKIDVVNFTDEANVQSKYIDRPYFIEPDKRSEKAYVLLREALKRSRKVGLAKFTIRTKERTAIVKAEGRILMLIALRLKDGLRKSKNVRLLTPFEYSNGELDMALTLINQLQEHFEASRQYDMYREELQKLVAKKTKRQPVRIESGEELTLTTDMHDLVATLRKSLEQGKRRSRRKIAV